MVKKGLAKTTSHCYWESGLLKESRKVLQFSCNLRILMVWDFSFKHSQHWHVSVGRVSGSATDFALVLLDLTSHVPPPFNLRGKLILTTLQGGIVYCLLEEKLEKASSARGPLRQVQWILDVSAKQLPNRVWFGFQAYQSSLENHPGSEYFFEIHFRTCQ